jgi:hypothetical protein
MNRIANRLLGTLAILVAALTLVFSSDPALACNSGAHAEHGLHHKKSSVSEQTSKLATATGKTSQVDANHVGSNAVDDGDQQNARNVSAKRLKERPHTSHTGHCPPHKSICCYKCPEALEVVVLQSRQRDAIEVVTRTASGFIEHPFSLDGSADTALIKFYQSDPPRPLVQMTTWRAILLMGSARLRI